MPSRGVLVWALAAFMLLVSLVNAHAFQQCPNTVDHLHVSKLSVDPDPPKAGSKVTVTISLKPDRAVKSVKAHVIAKVLGVRVFQVEVNACEYISCPLSENQQADFSYSMELPAEVPKGVELQLQVEIHDESNALLTCITTKVDTHMDAATKAELEDGENVHLLGATPHILNSNGVITESGIRFLFEMWLKQFHHTAEISAWYPALPSDDEKTREEKTKEFRARFLLFAGNVVKILRHNKLHRAGKVSYAMALNQFGHLHNDEFAKQYLTGYVSKDSRVMPSSLRGSEASVAKAEDSYIRIPSLSEMFSGVVSSVKSKLPGATSTTKNKVNNVPISDLPEEVDWVAKGALNPVKNQGSCGSCWAFSAIGALESAYFLKYGVSKTFSEQFLVSCENDCYGCGGGLMDLAFDFIRRNGGICTDQDYPYSSGASGANGFCRQGKCQVDPNSAVKSFVDVEHTEEGLMNALVLQPVSVAIEADQYAFQFYSHGVMTGECGDRLNHGVIAVGYGTLDGTMFWKLRNSWGATWGMEGYILIERGKIVPTGDEECGILANPSYPVL